ncbi:MAG: TetR/AcrR family transcriptional regulator [Acidobacteriota bacterium]
MPWQKNFEIDDALESAMQVFWAKGYDATSIADLTDATGVQRQSLYNAIGDKRSLFIRCLLKYDTEQRQAKLASLESRGTPVEAIRDLFTSIVEDSSCSESNRGCFLVNTALALQGHDEEVRVLVTSALEDFRSFFKRLVQHAKVRGDVASDLDADATASGLMAAFVGMQAMARGAVEQAVLSQMAEQSMRLVA